MLTPRTSLRDIAARANVSKATVSLALRDHPRITEPVRKRIQALALQMRYVPDPVISRLAANGWGARREHGHTMVAFISSMGTPAKPGGLDFFKSLQEHGPRMGYQIDYFSTSGYPSPQRLAEVLTARGIQGVILYQISDQSFVERFPWERYATVCCSVSIAMPSVHLVTSDYTMPMQNSWEICRRAGYRRIGFALLTVMSSRDDIPRSGVADYLERNARGKGMARVPVRHFGRTDAGEFVAWVKKNRLDAVAGLTPTFLFWLRQAGYRVPEDIGFISLILGGNDLNGKISGWDNRAGQVARCSLEQLDLMIRSASRGLPESSYTLLIPPTWVPGHTLRSAPP
ncbi:MAG: LacI family DNA-binding transcriptional regulator [Opitutaceae bacterium]